MKLRALILVLALHYTVHLSYAELPFEQRGIIMLQTKDVFLERVSGMEALEVYVKALVDAVDGAVVKQPKSAPSAGFLVVAVKPDGRSRIWLDVDPQLKDDIATSIRSAAQNVPPLPVKNGVVLFGIKISLWGGEPPKGMVPRPKEWEAEANKVDGSIELGELVVRVWPD